ncbi:MAG: RNA polymerase sigma factor [Pirellulales bacterium]
MSKDSDDRQPEPSPDGELLAALRDGDEDAAAALFKRYHLKIRNFARGEMGPLLRGTEESWDVAQSALLSLFTRGRDGKIQLGSDDSLWPLLAKITLNKVRSRGKFWTRQRRDRRRQVSLEDCGSVDVTLTPEAEARFDEAKQELLARLRDAKRQEMAQYFLDGLSEEEIARRMGVHKRTVRRVRQAVEHILKQMFAAS